MVSLDVILEVAGMRWTSNRPQDFEARGIGILGELIVLPLQAGS